MRKVVLLIAGVALVATACRAEVNLIVDVEEDRSGVVVIEFGADDEFIQLIESTGGDPNDLFGALDLEIEGSTTTQRTEGDMSYWGIDKTFDDVDEISAALTEATDAAGATFTDLSFEMDEEQAMLEARIDSPSEALESLPVDPGLAIGQLDDVISFNFIFGMPGTVVEHNADEVLTDGSLLWEIPVTGGTKEMVATSEFGSSSLWWIWLIIGVVLLVGAVALIVAVLDSRRRSKKAVDDAAAQSREGDAAEDVGATESDGDEGDGDDGPQPE
jgi:hypothetical protein